MMAGSHSVAYAKLASHALQGMGAGSSVFDAADVKSGAVEVDLIPSQVAQLSRSETISERHQNRRRVPMHVLAFLCSLDHTV